MIRTTDLVLETVGHCDVHDITPKLSAAIGNSGLHEGHLLVFVPGSTAGVTTVEFEPGLVRDLNEFFEKLIPEGRDYHHHATWGDDNGSSHVRAALLGPSLMIPFRRRPSGARHLATGRRCGFRHASAPTERDSSDHWRTGRLKRRTPEPRVLISEFSLFSRFF